MSPRGDQVNRRLREASRRKILATALELFAEKGFAGTSMAEIAERAEISKGLAYNYFASKDQVLETLLTQQLRRLLRQAASIDEARGPRERLRQLIRATLESVRKQPERERLLISLLLQPAATEAAMRAKRRFKVQAQRHRSRLRRLFSELGFEDPDSEAIFFGATMRGLTLTALLAPSGSVDLNALATRLEGLYLKGGARR